MVLFTSILTENAIVDGMNVFESLFKSFKVIS